MTPAVVPNIVLTTQNAKFSHASMGLRCLRANLGALRDCAVLCEGTVQDKPTDLAERLLALSPRIIGLGVYIWNARVAQELVAILKRVAPEVTVVLGGPEVSFEADQQLIVELADYVVQGEGEAAFATLCAQLLRGERPANKIIPGGLPDLATLAMPYDEYTDQDLAERVVYVEASRGCPFFCEFCLSSLDTKVRTFDLERFLAAMDGLWRRGLRHFKFVDRTFNLSPATSRAIVRFFLERYEPGTFVHFQMVPDRLPEPLRELVAQFPDGALQFEVGIQTFDVATSARISRRQDISKLVDNLTYLRAHTGVHVHADLIVGLPGEDEDSFARGLDRLVTLRPHEIQVGILKRLRGAPITRHDAAWDMRYSPEPPYEILSTKHLDFFALQRLKRFAKLWDAYYNSGNFTQTLPYLWDAPGASPYARFAALCERVFKRTGRVHALGLDTLVVELYQHLVQDLGLDQETVRQALIRDHVRLGRRPHPILESREAPAHRPLRPGIPKRQARHLA